MSTRSASSRTGMQVVLIGGGPRAAIILERLAANAPELLDKPLTVHIVEPYEVGVGRIWREDQSPLLKLNSMAADVTMFTDESVDCVGPSRNGPNLVEWARGVVAGTVPDVRVPTDDLARQLRDLQPTTFPTRRLLSLYLRWFFQQTLQALGPRITVVVHRDLAVDVVPEDPARHHSVPHHSVRDHGGYSVTLAGGETLTAAAVVTCVGHTDSTPTGRSAEYSRFAAENGLFHAAPAYTNDVDFSRVLPGQEVIVSGMGLAFIDLMVLLMEGRGGRFVAAEDGRLRYLPSGREPVLWVGSRRGVPYRSKIRSTLRGEPVGPLRYLTAGAVAALRQQHGQLDFRRHLWPLMAKEAAHGYYRELVTGHPERVTTSWAEFRSRFDDVDWYSAEREALVEETVPDAAFRLDLEELDNPLTGKEFGSSAELQQRIAAHIGEDLRVRDGESNSETLGLFLGLLYVYFELGRLVPPDALTPRSRPLLTSWWHGFFSYVDSGPPAHRLRELLALQEAGLVRFLGPDLRIGVDHTGGVFTASSPQVPHGVSASALIEARLPGPSVAGSGDPLLRSLSASGLGSEERLDASPGSGGTGKLWVDPSARLLDSAGSAAPGLYAVGPATSGFGGGAFSRPDSNAPAFRDSDALVRLVLQDLRDRQPVEDMSCAQLEAAISGAHASLI